MAEKERDQEFLEFVIKGLVEHPDDVKINRVVDEMGVLLTLDLNGILPSGRKPCRSSLVGAGTPHAP